MTEIYFCCFSSLPRKSLHRKSLADWNGGLNIVVPYNTDHSQKNDRQALLNHVSENVCSGFHISKIQIMKKGTHPFYV